MLPEFSFPTVTYGIEILLCALVCALTLLGCLWVLGRDSEAEYAVRRSVAEAWSHIYDRSKNFCLKVLTISAEHSVIQRKGCSKFARGRLNMRRFILGTIPLAVLAGSLCGQEFRATVTGQVGDKSGAAIPGAKVRAIQRNTNQATEATTNHDGQYTPPYLRPHTDGHGRTAAK